VADCEVAEGVGCMTRPVMLRSKANIAVLVSSLMIIAKGIAPSFGRSLVELTAGKMRRAASIRIIAAPAPVFLIGVSWL
jgi:hypothetical protein